MRPNTVHMYYVCVSILQFFKRFVAYATLFDLLFLSFLVHGTGMRRHFQTHYIVIAWMMLTGSSWKLVLSRLEAGLQVVCSDELTCFFEVKVSRRITQCFPFRIRTYAPHIRGSNGPDRPMSISYSMIVQSQAHCPRGNFCMGIPTYFQITPLYQ
jgi:hypothetical protein